MLLAGLRSHERPQHFLDHYRTMLDRTTKTGHEKPSPQKLKTKGTIHLLTFLLLTGERRRR